MQGWKALIARIEILSPKIENLNPRDMITLVAALMLSLPNAATGFARVNVPTAAQDTTRTSAPQRLSSSKVFDVVEQMPQYPGGPQALFTYLATRLQYPAVAEENGVQGRVIVTFVISEDGSVTDAKIAKSVDPSLDKEALRLVRSMPKWTPGRQNGKAERVRYTVPVTFRLQ